MWGGRYEVENIAEFDLMTFLYTFNMYVFTNIYIYTYICMYVYMVHIQFQIRSKEGMRSLG